MEFTSKTKLIDVILDDVDFLNSLTMENASIKETAEMIKRSWYLITHSGINDINHVSDHINYVNVLNGRSPDSIEFWDGIDAMTLIEYVKTSAISVFDDIRQYGYKTVSESIILVGKNKRCKRIATKENIDQDMINEFITENIFDILGFYKDSCHQESDDLMYRTDPIFFNNFFKNGIIIVKNQNQKEMIQHLSYHILDYISDIIHNRQYAAIFDYSSLYRQKVNELESTKKWLDGCQIRYEETSDELQIELSLKSWDRYQTLVDEDEGLRFIFSKETNQLIAVRPKG